MIVILMCYHHYNIFIIFCRTFHAINCQSLTKNVLKSYGCIEGNLRCLIILSTEKLVKLSHILTKACLV